MSAAGARLRTAGLLAASCHPGPALAVTVVAALLAVGVGLSPGQTTLLTAAVLTGQLSIGWSNDLIDRHRDRRTGRGDKPLAGDTLSPAVVRVACGVALAACVVLSLALGALAGSVHLLGVACGWAYNLGLKATAWSWLPYAVAFGALAAVPSLAGGDSVAWWLPVVGALLGVGAHLVNVLPDLDDDAATGVRGLPHRIAARSGPAAVTRLAVLLFVTGTALLLAVVPAGRARWLAGGLVGVLAVTALRGSGRTPFRVAIAIALVDVALLAWAV
jgi:4-hydroxybenzoate polyprenyltransferase